MCPNDRILVGKQFLTKEDIVSFHFYRKVDSENSPSGTPLKPSEPKIGMIFRGHPEELFFTCSKDATFSRCICEFMDS